MFCFFIPVTSEAPAVLQCLWGITALMYLPLTAHTGAHLRQWCGTTMVQKAAVTLVLGVWWRARRYKSSADANPEWVYVALWRGGSAIVLWLVNSSSLEDAPVHTARGDALTITWLDQIVCCVCRDCAHYVTLFALLFNCRSTVYYINTGVWLLVW